jgi:hypothetical protein
MLGRLMRHANAIPFLEPVDHVAMQLPDYLDVIQNPMDLGTVMSKLRENFYSQPPALLSDILRTFHNAIEYNPACEPAHKMAVAMKAYFISLCNGAQELRKTLQLLDLEYRDSDSVGSRGGGLEMQSYGTERGGLNDSGRARCCEVDAVVHKKVLEDVMAVDDHAYCTEEDETVANIAAKLGVNAHHLLQLNKSRYRGLVMKSRLFAGTLLLVPAAKEAQDVAEESLHHQGKNSNPLKSSRGACQVGGGGKSTKQPPQVPVASSISPPGSRYKLPPTATRGSIQSLRSKGLTTPFVCRACNIVFGTPQALGSHKRCSVQHLARITRERETKKGEGEAQTAAAGGCAEQYAKSLKSKGPMSDKVRS